ncbi:MAG TPA: cytochrome P450 [Pseudomonadales bacterium]
MSEAIALAAGAESLSRAREEAYAVPLEELNVARAELFEQDLMWPYFERLRAEAPVHYCAQSDFGPYWSVSTYDLIKEVDTSHEIFSSEPTITIDDPEEDFDLPMFIAMDPPKHDEQRKVVSPVVGPRNLAALEPVIRQRVQAILDSLPVGETFDWVDRVSIELTTQMLATLFDFPWEERRKLTRWSDVTTANVESGLIESEEQRRAELFECLEFFTGLWHDRASRAPGNDLISLLAHGQATRDLVSRPMEYLGNLVLLIVGGNDTTRNSLSGGVLANNLFPEQFAKLKADPGLIPNMVSEIIRWQTPLAHMRRTAKHDTMLGGRQIRAGDKVVMWYVSGNRDESMFPNADDFIIDRENARKHIAFGFGLHRCMGNRVAEMQLRIAWEEILKRFSRIEVVGEPVRVRSGFVKGYLELPVRVRAA